MRSVRRTIGIFTCLCVLLAIMNQVGKILFPGETGEAVSRGIIVTSGYNNNPLANQHAFLDEWFQTGDQEVLLAHPAIAQAVTFAVPDARLGEEIAAAVVLRDNLLAEVEGLSDEDAKRLFINKAWQHAPRQDTHVILGRWQHAPRQNIHVILGRRRQ